MEQKLYPLTNPQKSIYLTEEYYKGTNINSIAGIMAMHTVVDFDKFILAIKHFAKQNDGCRLNFKRQNEEVLQFVTPYQDFEVPIVSVSSLEEVSKMSHEIAAQPFDIYGSYLFKFVVFRLPNNHGGFIIHMHHLISDAWTMGILVNEIVTTYADLVKGCRLSNKDISLYSYTNYIASEQEYKKSNKYEKDKAYWEEVFTTIPEVATIPTAKANSTTSDSNIQAFREEFCIDGALLTAIKEYCTTQQVSLFNFLTAIFSIYIGRVSNLDDFCIGTPILNRSNFKEKAMTGMFINILPLRVTMNHEASFNDFVHGISNDSMSLLRHQKYAYQSILEDLRKRQNSLPSLYKMMLSYQITKMADEQETIPHDSTWLFNGSMADDIDIHIFDLNDANKLTIAYDYLSQKYTCDDMEKMHKRILAMIAQVLEDGNLSVGKIAIVTPNEERQLLVEFNNTAIDYPRDKTIIELFEEQVLKHANDICITFEEKSLTYFELNEKANQLAHFIQNHYSIKAGDVVGLFIDKSLEMIIAMYAILKAGATFLPLDIELPTKRLRYILDNAKPKLILTSYALSEITQSLNLPSLEIDLSSSIYQDKNTMQNLPIITTPDDLIYIIYTSGSTGTPKGVMVKQRNIVRLVKNPNFLSFKEHEIMVQTGTIVFDACIFEIFGSLLNGFRLYILTKEEILDIAFMKRFIKEKQVSILFLTTGLLNGLANEDASIFQGVNYLLTGGDVISPAHVAKIYEMCPSIQMINCYGPTENGSYSTCYPIPRDTSNLANTVIPIGKPISNSSCFVVSKSGALQPIGVPGELWVGGDGIARGYINRDDLTKEKFIKSPFGDGLVYKTGDLVKYLPDGNIVFLSRIDKQIKLRGFRIELEEIDANILKFAGVKQSVCALMEVNGQKAICAYITSDKQIDETALRSFLATILPDYMIPKYIMQLASLPLSISGKIDRSMLPIPTHAAAMQTIVPARNDMDALLVSKISTLLHLKELSITDSFFDIGGDSLSAISLVNSINSTYHTAMTVRDIFKYPVISELSDAISKSLSLPKKDALLIKKAAKNSYYPISSAQKRVYYASSMEKDSVLYNIAGGILLDKPLDTSILQSCFEQLIARHQALRTYFDIQNEEVVQIVADEVAFKLETAHVTTDDLNQLYTDFVKPFDLKVAPLFRAKAVSCKNGKMLLLLDMHHLICDGTSLSVLMQELCNLYNGKALPENQVDYIDFSLWEQEQFKKDSFKQVKDFWVNQYQDEIPLLNMPTTYARPSVQSFEGSNYYQKLPKDIFDKIQSTSKSLGITPYMLMLSVYYILLSKYTSQEDIVVGSPIVGRELPELADMVGMFVNTLALRRKVDSSFTFAEFSKNVKEYCLDCFKNQAYPFDRLVQDLKLKTDTSRSPLFDIAFIYQNNGYPTINFKTTDAHYFIPNSKIAKYDLSLEVLPMNEELCLRFEYGTKLFDEDFVARFGCHYANILNCILDNTQIKIADIDMLSMEEKTQILNQFNNTFTEYPRDKTIISLFEEQVEKTPDKVAIVFENQSLTYKELNKKANQLARFLLANHVASGDIICLLLDKSLEAIVAMLAVLKCGCAFLPLDVAYPKDRIDYIIKNSNAKLLLTSQAFVNKASYTIASICVDLNTTIYANTSFENVNITSHAQDLVYIMYTSGSTGNPKGAMITNQNVVRLVKNNKFITFDEKERILQTGSIVFDACTFEIWGALLNGYELHIITKLHLLNPVYLKDYLRSAQITSLFLTTQLFNQLCEADPLIFSTVNNLLTGGEAVSVKHMNLVNEKNANLKVIHCYGPTENTTFSTCFDVPKVKYKYTVPIGTPISNSTAYIVSNTKQLCPIGVPGELWVGGDGVGLGYLNNPELTAEKFTANPFGSGMVYKTGDLVKWLPDGTIEFVGRIDNQVKIRGFRIELSEIDMKILEFPNIKYSITVTNMVNNEKTICSYFVSDTTIDIIELKNYLQKCLPYFMIPSYLTQLENFSLNINGKIDTKCLPTNFKQIKKVHKIVLPKTDYEKSIYQVFKKVLNIDNLSITDDLFKDLNGDSLTAMKIQIEALSENLSIDYADIFKYSTIKSLAYFMEHDKNIVANSNHALDSSKYDSILAKNVIDENLEIKSTPLHNILLTGFTGFLGAHVLDSFIKKETGTVYCLIRNKNQMTAIQRLYNVLHFYFKDKYDKFVGNRIKLIEGDLTLANFGLSEKEYHALGNDISTAIHCAALVKHYGMYEEFEKANVLGTKQIVDFCKEFHLKLLHISTLSVSGNNFADGSHTENNLKKEVDFGETNFYIGQNLESLYARSKFEAEKIVLDAICDFGLEATILRMGNLTSRVSEGQFQQNHFENAFVNRFKSFLQIGYMPDYMLELYAEFTPIDYCGDAIIEIARHFNRNYTVLHLMNEKRVYLDRLYQMMQDLGLNMKVVPEQDFIHIINDLLNNDKTKMYIEGIINDFDKSSKHLVYDSKVKIQCDFSVSYLEKLGFSWPYIDIHYMRNYFKYLEDIGYLNVNLKEKEI